MILEQDPYYKSLTYLITWLMDLMCLSIFLYNYFMYLTTGIKPLWFKTDYIKG